jgi:hypothetical protein
MTITVQGIQFQTTGKTLIVPKNEAVLAYLEAAKNGKGLVEKYLKNKSKK